MTDHRPAGAAARSILRLTHDLAALRLRYANLLAAARATLAAVQDGEPDALEYLADELADEHDQHDLRGGRWNGEGNR